MRVAIVSALVAMAIAPATALAHSKHTHVRDHRHGSSSSSGGHHSSGGGWSALLVDVLATVADSTSSANVSEPEADDPNEGATWVLEFGGLARRFQGPTVRRNGTVDGNPYMLDSGAGSPGDTTSAAFDMRATVAVADHLYAGAELEVRGLVRSPILLQRTNNGPDLRVATRMLVGSASVLGARLQAGPAELDGEIAAGCHVVLTTIQSDQPSGDDTPSDSANVVRPLLEARLRGALWLSPRMFVAGQLGTSALDHSDVNVAFAVGFASRAYAHR